MPNKSNWFDWPSQDEIWKRECRINDDPVETARRIRERYGADYCDQLVVEFGKLLLEKHQ